MLVSYVWAVSLCRENQFFQLFISFMPVPITQMVVGQESLLVRREAVPESESYEIQHE